MLYVRPALACSPPTRAPSFNFLLRAIQQSGSSYPLSRLKRAFAGLAWIYSASFITSSMVWLACCIIFVSFLLMGWLSVQAYSDIADLSVWPLMQASLYYLSLVSRHLTEVYLTTNARYFVNDVRLFLGWERVFDVSE